MLCALVQLLSPDVDAEDDNPSSFGPPPDPSLRSWRHPSEIAAGKAAFEQPAPAIEPPVRRTPILLGAAAVIGICLVGFTIVGQAEVGPSPVFSLESEPLDGDTLGEIDADEINNASFAAGTSAPTTTVLASRASTTSAASQLLAAELHVAPLDRAIDFNLSNQRGSDDATAERDVADGDTAKPEVLRTDSGGPESSPSEGPTPPTKADEILEFDSAMPHQVPGLLALFGDPAGEPLANGIVVDGLILTSTSSLQGRSIVYANLNSAWTSLDVVAADPHSDIAVLTAINLGSQLSPVVTAPGGPTADAGQMVAILGAHEPMSARSTSKPEAAGELVATNDRITSADGYQIMGALLTTCRNNELYGGAALVDNQGHVLGLVVKSDQKLAAAIPLDVAIEIGRSLMLDGSRGGAWLGVSGRTVQDGFMLDFVDPDGPAALAGLQTGDLISRVNGKPLSDLAELLHTLRLFASGDTIDVTILRFDTATGEIEPIILEIVLSAKGDYTQLSANQATGNS